MRILLFILLLTVSTHLISQDGDEKDTEELAKRVTRFQAGFYLGPYFPNKYTASTYNGYGFDLEGKQNTFANSLMRQKIINEYGGGYGQTDQVALALEVDPGRWEFNESDMPVNMHYLTAFMVGLNLRFPLSKKNAFILNANASSINVEGNFTITMLRPPGANPGITNNIKTCTIVGKEQRALFQFGYQRLVGKDEKIQFLGELGFVGTLAKYDKNQIYINNLQIDLTNYINQALFPAPGPSRKPVGFGLGAFVGAGANVNFNQKVTLQFLYTLTHERVNIGLNPQLKLQHSLGLRVYYNMYYQPKTS